MGNHMERRFIRLIRRNWSVLLALLLSLLLSSSLLYLILSDEDADKQPSHKQQAIDQAIDVINPVHRCVHPNYSDTYFYGFNITFTLNHTNQSNQRFFIQDEKRQYVIQNKSGMTEQDWIKNNWIPFMRHVFNLNTTSIEIIQHHFIYAPNGCIDTDLDYAT